MPGGTKKKNMVPTGRRLILWWKKSSEQQMVAEILIWWYPLAKQNFFWENDSIVLKYMLHFQTQLIPRSRLILSTVRTIFWISWNPNRLRLFPPQKARSLQEHDNTAPLVRVRFLPKDEARAAEFLQTALNGNIVYFKAFPLFYLCLTDTGKNYLTSIYILGRCETILHLLNASMCCVRHNCSAGFAIAFL